jgi:hypothetical protein
MGTWTSKIQWGREISQAETDTIQDRINELKMTGATDGEFYHSATDTIRLREWATQADAQAWVTWINSTFTPPPGAAEAVELTAEQKADLLAL